jgi:hypothetical protein
MLRRSTLALAAAGLALSLAGVPAPAAADGADRLTHQPAATLLLPYFEVDLPKKPGSKPKGRTTILSINAADATAMLAHVTIWSDLGVPVTAFDVYLTGYDVQTVDLAEVIAGRLPQTASAGQDPQDVVSPQGDVSQDINFASCNGILPYPEDLGPDFVDHMRASLTGEASPLFGGLCAGRDYDEKKPVARGFVTVDAVNQCSLLFPSQPGYFVSGGFGVANNQNRLWGDYAYVDRGKKLVKGGTLVGVRADAADSLTSVPGNYTFYMRHVAAVASDNRQPLATNFGGRFVNDPKDPFFPGGTDVYAWRDSKVANVSPFTCGLQPPWFPLSQEQIVVFDEEENPQVPVLPPVPPLPPEVVIPFPAMAQKVRVGGPDLPVLFERGWIFMNLNTAVPAGVMHNDPAAAQAFVTMSLQSKASSVTHPAIPLDSATSASHGFIPVP